MKIFIKLCVCLLCFAMLACQESTNRDFYNPAIPSKHFSKHDLVVYPQIINLTNRYLHASVAVLDRGVGVYPTLFSDRIEIRRNTNRDEDSFTPIAISTSSYTRFFGLYEIHLFIDSDDSDDSEYIFFDFYYPPILGENITYNNSRIVGIRHTSQTTNRTTDSTTDTPIADSSADPPIADSSADPPIADTLAMQLWHIKNIGQNAYSEGNGTTDMDLHMSNTLQSSVTGKGIVVAVVDTGLEIKHPDLKNNILPNGSRNFIDSDNSTDPYNENITGDHGTSVAGIIAAQKDNGLGGFGVAPGAKIVGFNYLKSQSYLTSIISLTSASVDIFNQSYGLTIRGDRNEQYTEQIYKMGTELLRENKGAIYVKAAGNNFNYCLFPSSTSNNIGCLNANIDYNNNTPYNIVVGGFNADGEKASYSSVGSMLWVSAPSGEFGINEPAIITTDQTGCIAGYNHSYNNKIDDGNNSDCDYTSTFNGTSSAAPNTSGAIALILEVNPQLTWRDVKHILAKTAYKIDPTHSNTAYYIKDQPYIAQLGWITNGSGYHFNNWYGFGAIDVDKAIELTRTISANQLGEFTRVEFSRTVDLPIIDFDASGIESSIEVVLQESKNIEALVLKISILHPFTYDLGIHLISPAGTESILNPIFNEGLINDSELGKIDWPNLGSTDARHLPWKLLSNAFYGEDPNGKWTIKVVDAAEFDTGSLIDWGITFYLGTHPND